jgi:gluconolactonase
VNAEVVADDIRFGEGPVWCPDGTLVVTSVCDGVLWRIEVDSGAKSIVADVDGGANGAALCADGGFLVTQNGGVDFSKFPIWGNEEPPSPRHAVPGLQRVGPDGSVSYLAGDDVGFHAPNDLAVATDGSVYFTDPGHYPPPAPPIGRVMVLRPDGAVEEFARDFWFCNGIAFDLAGDVVVVEKRGLQRVNADGSREWVIEKLGEGGSDGFCLDTDGRYYACATVEHGVRVVDPDGSVVDFLEIDGDGVTTNCCFGGAEGRTLFATDSIPGRVVAWEGLPAPGLPLPAWPGLS